MEKKYFKTERIFSNEELLMAIGITASEVYSIERTDCLCALIGKLGEYECSHYEVRMRAS